jgi:hypothetical protein
MAQYRFELDRARDEIFRIFNEANEGKDTDIRCKAENPTGSRMRQNVCRSAAENRGDAAAAKAFLNALFAGSAGFNTNGPLGTGTAAAPPAVNSIIGTGRAQGDAENAERGALAAFEAEWTRLLAENRDLYQAVSTYAALEDEYNRARGSDTAPPEPEVTVLLEAPAAQTIGPQCEASTLTEYQQRNNVARVSGKVSVSNCEAGTTGSFTLVARVRDDAGEIKPIEFNETWQRADPQDHSFTTEYPIGDGVELMNVRVRNLKCTCAAPAQ